MKRSGYFPAVAVLAGWVTLTTLSACQGTGGTDPARIRVGEPAGSGATTLLAGASLRLVVALPPPFTDDRAAQNLAGFIDRIDVEIAGSNIPGGKHMATFTRREFRGRAVVLVLGRLLPGQVEITVTMYDRSGRRLGRALSGPVELTLERPAEATLSLVPEEATAVIPFDPVALEPTRSVRLEARIVPLEPGHWEEAPPLLRPRAGGSAVVHDGKVIMVLGGPDPSIEERAPQTGLWRHVSLPASLSVMIRDAAIQSGAGSIHVVGGDNFGVVPGMGENIEVARLRPEAAFPDRVQDVSRAAGFVVGPFEGGLPRAGAGSATWGEELLLFGGREERLPASGLARQGWVLPPTGWAYAFSRGSWRRMAGLNVPRADLAAATTGPTLAALGGRTLTGANGRDRFSGLPWFDSLTANWTAVADVEIYDPVEDRWQAAPSLPEPRWDLAAAGAEGRIWVSGGRDASGEPTATVWSWAPGDSVWRVEWPLARPRAAHAMVRSPEGLLLVMGGDGLQPGTMRSVEVMQP